MSLSYVSASQVQRFQECPTRWITQYLQGIQQPVTPQMLEGTEVHTEIESYLKTGEIRESKWATLIAEGAKFCPHPREPGLLVENKLVIPTYQMGPDWVGYLDLGYVKDGMLHVDDWKSKGSMSSLKSKRALAEDIQLNSYAVWLLAHAPKLFPGVDTSKVKLTHIYLARDGSLEVKRVEVVVSRGEIAEIWKKSLDIVREMVRWSEINPSGIEETPKNPASCGIYGGCHLRERCGFDVMIDSSFVAQNKRKDKEERQEGFVSVARLSLKERLKLKEQEAVAVPAIDVQALAAEVAKTPVAVTIVKGIDDIARSLIIPPDAPDRDAPLPPEPVAEAAPAPEAPKKKGKKAPAVEIGEAFITVGGKTFVIRISEAA